MLALNENSNTSNNILLSLEYLKEEAKRENNMHLSEIIDAACFLAQNKQSPISYDKSNVSYSKDIFYSALFFLKFLNAPKDIQAEVLEFLQVINDNPSEKIWIDSSF